MKKLPQSLRSFFFDLVQRHWVLFFFTQIFSLAWAVDHTLWPYVFMIFIDTITAYTGNPSEALPALAWPIFLGISLWIIVEISFRISGILLAKLIPTIEAETRMTMFDYVQHHSYKYFSDKMAGTIANKIADMPTNMTMIISKVITIFVPVFIAIIISSLILTTISPLFAAILLTWVCVHMGICFLFARKCVDYSNIHAESRSTLAGRIVDSLSNHLNIKLFARHRYEFDYVNKFQQEERTKQWESLWYIEKMKIFLGIASFLGAGVGIYGFMIYSWMHGMLTTGEVVFVLNTTLNITMMVWWAGLELPSLYRELGVCKQALTIIQDPLDITDDPHAKLLKVDKGEIAFENVTFHYTKNHNLFQDKNILINAGEKVGLVGFSGSGKTTFVNLILRYFDVEKGRILIDNQDITKVTQDSLRKQIALIPQDPILFHRTLMENIRYGRIEATDEEVIEAAKQANCHEFIERMPEKYQTLVGERGIKLSGGQKQRIAIARAILKNAPILILDEATSALDSLTEREIQDALSHLMVARTVIVVAHRLSTLSGMDRILVFEEGHIVEDGSHEELIYAGGHYAQMWNMQAEGFLPEDSEEALSPTFS